MNILTIDIGNTNITLGIFKGKHLIHKTKIPTPDHSLQKARFKSLFTRCQLSSVIVSSVVPEALSRLKNILRGIADCKILVLGENIDVPIKNLYRIKRQVGQDRLVNAFAAKTIYGTPCVIVDFGTAITFDIVSRKGEYLGGLILPGIDISLSSLYEKTALLPKVKLAQASSIIGKDTVGSMRGGILFGFGAMCDGLVAKYRKILGKDTKVIATGGNSSLIKRYTRSIETVDVNLTLKGLNLLAKK